ncbi:MAG: AmmeMemoRadiSam system protein A [Deltaproteobacteria bacterium]|nr:AmmeMemoRadiSam system protein A [Deltaproteobacteria bacterium]
MTLKEEEKRTLLDMAKQVIRSALDEKDVPDFDIISPVLREKRGAFVTLKKKGQLRGCIGYIEGIKPLYRTVMEMAVAAAFQDPRFPPLKRGEFEQLDFEISVLTPLEEVTDIEDIEVGHHGLYIVKGFRSGLLLPQVAVEHHWDRETFLMETCYKAGLSTRAWKDPDTKIYRFSADVFGDH